MDFTKLNKEQLSSHLESEILKIKDVKDIIRINFWWIFFELIKKILNDRLKSEKDKKKKILLKLTILTQLVNKTAKEVYNSQNEIDRKINEIKIDVINRYLEEHTIYAEDNKILLNNESDFEYYPEYSDNLFNKKVYQKKEFNENIFPKLSLENRGKSKSFKKSPSQKFVKNFISTTTPYNGILLWHGVGVGKTCAAISIAENFRNIVYQNDKKILVLTPSDTIQQNWKDEIFSIEKENNNVNSVNVQCTGLRYKNSLSNYEEKTNKQKILAVNKLINKYYEIMGYQKLTNEIEKYFNSLSDIVKPENIENRKIKYIKEKFSNRVIIMDEVHVTREGGTNKDDKKSRPYIEMICRYAENTKLILLTATPMYNISKEIIWLLNLLLWNDKQSPLEETHIFKKNGIDLQDYPEDTERISDGKHKLAIEYLIKKSRGYVSYIRGENPYIFPLKLNPEKSLTYTPSPKLKLESKKWVPLKETEKIKEDSMQFYKNSLSLWQFNELKKYLSNVDDEISGSMSSIKKSSFSRQPLQASNIVYPNPNFYIDDNPELKGELRGELGERLGLNNSFIYDSENDKYTYNKTSKIDLGSINSDNKGFLHLDYIQKYSIKFHSILKNILTCKGIAFVYSQFISHGIKPFALSLEENGFERYVLDGNTNNFLSKPIKQADKYCGYHKKYYRNLTESEKKNFRQAKYIYLDGKLKKKDLDQLVKSVKGQELDKDNEYINNDNGQHVMVILGSRVIEQGISFFGVREIHIMDPWHHLNMMEQASGRGIRQKSHFHLPVNMRNVTQYLHIAALPKSLENLFQETSDERIYRNAYFKKNKMTEIERILKEYAIDCSLNKYANMFSQSNYPDTFNIENSKGKIINNVNIFDKDGSLKCDFKNCDYKCDWENIDPDYTVNTDTFSKEFMLDSVENVKEFVKLLFIDEYVFSLESIIRIIKSDYDSRTTNEYIYIALDEIIKNKEIVQDMYNRKGYIIYREGSYIFQPLEINNTNLLYYDRIHPLSIKNYSVKLDNTKQLNQIVKVKSKIKFKSLNLKKKKKRRIR
uniref:Helicase ATP-binding domain-containing protein n=1 Tax=viral metagenome TaxID=1070528 RepID=A0A6C0IVT0_9ZZZZ